MSDGAILNVRDQSIMARMRFPGRPGNRVDRVSIPFYSEDLNGNSDPAIQLVSNLRYGLQEFNELCGDSEVSALRRLSFDPKWLPSTSTRTTELENL